MRLCRSKTLKFTYFTHKLKKKKLIVKISFKMKEIVINKV